MALERRTQNARVLKRRTIFSKRNFNTQTDCERGAHMGFRTRPERNFRTQGEDDLEHGLSEHEKTSLAGQAQNATGTQPKRNNYLYGLLGHMTSFKRLPLGLYCQTAGKETRTQTQNATGVRLCALDAKTQIQNAHSKRSTKCPWQVEQEGSCFQNTYSVWNERGDETHKH